MAASMKIWIRGKDRNLVPPFLATGSRQVHETPRFSATCPRHTLPPRHFPVIVQRRSETDRPKRRNAGMVQEIAAGVLNHTYHLTW